MVNTLKVLGVIVVIVSLVQAFSFYNSDFYSGSVSFSLIFREFGTSTMGGIFLYVFGVIIELANEQIQLNKDQKQLIKEQKYLIKEQNELLKKKQS